MFYDTVRLVLLLALVGCAREVPAAFPDAPPDSVSHPATRPQDVPIDVYEQMEIEAAILARDCRFVDETSLMLHVNEQQREFVENCWSQRQREIIAPAMASGRCENVMRLPGIYPNGSPPKDQRFVYHCWMAHGQMDLDSCIGMIQVGDATSVPWIITVLKRNEPTRMENGEYTMIDTAGACVEAFERITRRKARDAAREWGGSWASWAAQRN